MRSYFTISFREKFFQTPLKNLMVRPLVNIEDLDLKPAAHERNLLS
jgi:hypothetical protein